MTTKIMNNHELKSLQPAYGLWQFYHPDAAPHRFTAEAPQEARRWQRKTRRALELTLGFSNLPVAPLAPERVEIVDKGEYIREKWLLSTWEHATMPLYLLIPKGGGPFPVTLAFHGHGYGVKDIVGLWEDGQERDMPEGYHADFAVALCKRGFLVAAPEISCFGERQTDFSYLNTTIGQEIPSTCDHAAKLAFHLGGTVLGLRVHDARRLVDYLETRPEADIHRLGAMGISGGGMLTFFTTCLEERIRACVISGYYSTFQDSILAMNHCTCNFVPGLGLFGEMYDLAGLIAPRPLLVEAGTYDPIFPLAAVQRSVDITRQRVYRVFGAESQVALDIFEGRHRISGKLAFDFLYEKLGR
jgi:dienelactone hydrolase